MILWSVNNSRWEIRDSISEQIIASRIGDEEFPIGESTWKFQDGFCTGILDNL